MLSVTPTPRATRRPSADYKITAEALRVASELVRVLRPAPPQVDFADFQAFVPPLFACAKARLLAQDQGQKVKECAISCMGLALRRDAFVPGDCCAWPQGSGLWCAWCLCGVLMHCNEGTVTNAL